MGGGGGTLPDTGQGSKPELCELFLDASCLTSQWDLEDELPSGPMLTAALRRDFCDQLTRKYEAQQKLGTAPRGELERVAQRLLSKVSGSSS